MVMTEKWSTWLAIAAIGLAVSGCESQMKYNLGAAKMRADVSVDVTVTPTKYIVAGRTFDDSTAAMNSALSMQPSNINFYYCPIPLTPVSTNAIEMYGASLAAQQRYRTHLEMPSIYLSGRYAGKIGGGKVRAGERGCPEEVPTPPPPAAKLVIVMLATGTYRIEDKRFSTADEAVDFALKKQPQSISYINCTTEPQREMGELFPAFIRRKFANFAKVTEANGECSTASSGATAAAGVIAGAGELWEFTSVAERGGTETSTKGIRQVCRKPHSPIAGDISADCKVSDLKITGNKSSFKFVCPAFGGLQGSGEGSRTPDSYNGILSLNETVMRQTGRRLGSCDKPVD
jgi:hypothetical protein